jgi:hypothetical protein
MLVPSVFLDAGDACTLFLYYGATLERFSISSTSTVMAVMAGLVPAIPINEHSGSSIGTRGTSPHVTA